MAEGLTDVGSHTGQTPLIAKQRNPAQRAHVGLSEAGASGRGPATTNPMAFSVVAGRGTPRPSNEGQRKAKRSTLQTMMQTRRGERARQSARRRGTGTGWQARRGERAAVHGKAVASEARRACGDARQIQRATGADPVTRRSRGSAHANVRQKVQRTTGADPVARRSRQSRAQQSRGRPEHRRGEESSSVGADPSTVEHGKAHAEQST